MNHSRRQTLLLALLLGILLAVCWRMQPGARVALDATAAAESVDADVGAAPIASNAPAAAASAQATTAPTPAAPATREADVLPLDAPALGFRASPEQRAADLALLNAVTDLAPLLAEFQRRAAQGDADAAARVRDIYGECLGAHMYLGPSSNQIQAMPSAFGPPQAAPSDPARQAAVAIERSRCANILPGGEYKARLSALIRASRASTRLAADLGHTIARVQAGSVWDSDPNVRAQQQFERAHALLREGTPEALFALAQYGADATHYRPEAWLLAACALGYPCTGEPWARSFYCVQFGWVCASPSMQDTLQQLMPARDRRRAQAESAEILRLWRLHELAGSLRMPRPIAANAGGG